MPRRGPSQLVFGITARRGRVNVRVTAEGHYARHEWSICGRAEMTGNDPDSGFVERLSLLAGGCARALDR